MRLKCIITIVTLCFALYSVSLQAQISRNEWSFGPVLQTDNFLYADVGSYVIGRTLLAIFDDDADEMGEFIYKNRCWYPLLRYRANVVSKMEFAGGKAKVYPRAWGFSKWDWSLATYAVGYHVGYLSRVVPLGFDLQVDYAQDGFKIKPAGSDTKSSVKKRMISSTALLRIRLLKYESNRINPVLELGGSYDYAFHYHDDTINDKDAVNNGFNGIIGLGFTNTEGHISVSLRYEHSFYDFYNKDYLYDGNPMFAGSNSTFGRLSLAITFRH
ncbi:MAG: hypothetical protein LUB83_00620 [Prevotellaceae bacterium]|nr:hypothetical protein [Prevotellaceae bacterium]